MVPDTVQLMVRGGGLVLERAGVGGDAAGGDRPAAQRPEEALVPVLLLLGGRLGVGQGPGDALVGVVDVGIDGSPFLVFRRYFLSQMSWDAGCIGISCSAAVWS